jgi:hypothetical protein
MTGHTSNRMTSGRTVYYSIAAQWDNLGDIEIRNAVLTWMLQRSHRVVVFTGAMPASYIDAFYTDPFVSLESSAVRYQVRLWIDVVRRRASIVFAPGPQVFGPKLKSMAKSAVNWINVTGVRASGGRVLAVGRSLRGDGRLALLLERHVIAKFHLYVVRDTRSSTVVNRPLRGAPDLAFAGVGMSLSRELVVISLRGDRPIDFAGLQRLCDWVRSQGLRPVLVTQVKRDNEHHRLLADKLSVECVFWESESHSEQIARVKDTYSQARMVISNRLHALIFGLEYGAIPLAVIDAGSDKLLSTLEPWVHVHTTPSNFDLLDGRDWSGLDFETEHAQLETDLITARTALEEVRDDFQIQLQSTRSRASR